MTLAGPPSVQAGGSLKLSLTVRGLNGRELWIVSHPDSGKGYYQFLNGPAAVADGTGELVDPHAGNGGDAGHNITYLAYAADGTCSGFLRNTPPDAAGEIVQPVMDVSCGSPVATTTALLTK